MDPRRLTTTCTSCKKAEVPAKRYAWEPEICPTCTAKNIAAFLARNPQTPCQ